MRDADGNLDLTGFNLYGALGGAVAAVGSPRQLNHVGTHLSLIAGEPAVSASGGAFQLLSPASRYVSGPDSKPILQPALRGYSREGSEYFQPHIYLWQGPSRLTPGVAIDATEGLTGKPIMPLGYVFSPYDLSRLHTLMVGVSGAVVIYAGSQVLNSDYGLALDWADE